MPLYAYSYKNPFQKSTYKTRLSNGSDDMYDWRDYRLYNNHTTITHHIQNIKKPECDYSEEEPAHDDNNIYIYISLSSISVYFIPHYENQIEGNSQKLNLFGTQSSSIRICEKFAFTIK